MKTAKIAKIAAIVGAVVFSSAGCAENPIDTNLVTLSGDSPGFGQGTGGDSDGDDAGDSGPGDSVNPVGDAPGDGGGTNPGSNTEVCDGFDNDGDFVVDNPDIVNVGTSCSLPGNASGTEVCVNGVFECRECTPGETEPVACGCGESTANTCNATGLWLYGTCDGCPEPPTNCVCDPDETRIVRCDDCQPGNGCNDPCVGAVEQCGQDCQWHRISDCEGRARECNPDTVYQEACGTCGMRDKECDGCFFEVSDCISNGTCTPNEPIYSPCYSNACAPGWVQTTPCDGNCDPDPANSYCEGCNLGEQNTTVIECLENFPECGSIIETSECVQDELVPTCGNQALIKGKVETTQVGVCDIQCIPGTAPTYTACTNPAGCSGAIQTTCNNSCQLEQGTLCVPNNPCTIGQNTNVQTLACATGCGLTYETGETCNNGCDPAPYSTESTACGTCNEGSPPITRYVACSDPSNGVYCGLQLQEQACVNCFLTGTWVDVGACTPTAGTANCQPGTTQNQINGIACTAGGQLSCGTYDTWELCSSNGCYWLSQSNFASSCPPCAPGQTQNLQPSSCSNPGAGVFCGSQSNSQVCSASCQWQTQVGNCNPEPQNCNPGSPPTVQTLSCPNSCGGILSYQVSTTCNANGCGTSQTSNQATSCTAECLPGQTETDTQPCSSSPGNPTCGDQTRQRTCDPNTCTWGPWSGWGQCQLPCSPNQPNPNPPSCTVCGTTGPINQVCNPDGCGYDTGTCSVQQVCVPNTVQPLSCPPGFCGEETCDPSGCFWNTTTSCYACQ